MLVNIFSANQLSTLSTFNWGKLQLLNVDFFCLHNPYTRFLHFCHLCRLLRQTFRFHNPVSTGFVFFIHIIHISAVDCLCRMCSGKDTSHFQFSCAIMHQGNVGGCRTFRLLRLRKRSRFQWPILKATVTVQSLQPVFPTRLSMNICLMPTGNSSRFTSTCCAL